MMKNLGYAALSAVTVATLFIACGEGENGDLGCTTDLDCAGTEICHPDAQVCVETCESGSDCPDHARTCAAVSDTDTRLVCQCATDALCANGPVGDGAVCQDAWRVCTAACETASDCPFGFECEASTGQCKAEASNTCDPACGAGETCENGQCVATSCSTSAAQPDACPYGSYCASGGTCAAPAEPTCPNITDLDPAGGWDPRTWDPSNTAHNGPVIYSVTKGSDTSYPCANQAHSVLQAEVHAYRTDGDWPANKSGLSGFFWVQVNGTRQDATGAVMRNSDYQPNGREARLRVNFCFDSTQNQIQTAFYFSNGNAYCQALQR